MHKDAGRPWPIICPEDAVIDYMVMEAVALKVRAEDDKLQKDAEEKHSRDQFKSDTSSLEQFR